MKLWNASFKDSHVLCLGDLMLDRFIYGEVERVSPEAPVPVLKIRREFITLGGAGNVVRNLSALECPVTFMGVIGRDESGQHIKNQLKDLPHVTAHLIPEGRTIVKSRFVAQGQQLLRVDEDIQALLSQTTVETLKTVFLQHLATAKAIILSDYAKGALPPELCMFVIQSARSAGIPVIVDPKGHDYSRYKGATLITPNEKELAEVSARPLKSDGDIAVAMAALKQQLDLEAILVTRGSRGMVLLPSFSLSGNESEETVQPLVISTHAREVFDVSGAGDTVISTLAAAVSTGCTLDEAARLANIAAGIVVGKAGTAVVSQAELSAAIFNAEISVSGKVMTQPDMKNRVQAWRRQGLTIGFTNGCFDLLHLGHLYTLQQSRQVCDRLIVGLNSDASVQRLKGKDRPVQEETVRACVLAALEWVDGVILFEEDTPLALIEALLPDVLCKGADYRVDEIVGADIVRQNGGKVHLIDLKPGYSTTATVMKLTKIA